MTNTSTSFQAVIRTPGGLFIRGGKVLPSVESATKDAARLAKWAARKPTDKITIETTTGKTVCAYEG